MKIFKAPRFTSQILAILFAVSLSSCSVQVRTNRTAVKTKRIPPGQAKKITQYAPGQNK